MTEAQIRAHVVATAREWLGCRESNGSHRTIIDLYNAHKPLARGYKVRYTDAWCATFVSAVAIKCSYTDIMPTECSCSKMIELYRAKGRWQEDDGYTPSAGDLIMYDWEDSGKGDNKGAPNHVGIVCEVSGGKLTVIEGNLNNAVGYREIAVGGRYIRGYCLPDYASMAVEETAPSAKPSTEKVGKAITITVHQLSKGCKGEEVRALQALLILRGFDCGKSGTDGSFGTDTDKAVRAAQQHYGLDVDGYAGAKTLAALWCGE